MVGHELRLGQVGRTLQTHGKRVQTGPVGLGLGVVLDTHLTVFLGNGRDDAGVETAREEHTIGHVGHQLTPDGILQCIVDSLDRGRIILHGIIFEPVALVVALHAWVGTPIVMTGQERLVVLALSFERFQFGGHIHLAVGIATDIKGNHTDGVAGNEKLVGLLIVEHEGKDAAQVLEEVNTFLAIERQDDLAVGARLELILSGIAAADILMVIDLAIDSQDLFPVG